MLHAILFALRAFSSLQGLTILLGWCAARGSMAYAGPCHNLQPRVSIFGRPWTWKLEENSVRNSSWAWDSFGAAGSASRQSVGELQNK